MRKHIIAKTKKRQRGGSVVKVKGMNPVGSGFKRKDAFKKKSGTGRSSGSGWRKIKNSLSKIGELGKTQKEGTYISGNEIRRSKAENTGYMIVDNISPEKNTYMTIDDPNKGYMTAAAAAAEPIYAKTKQINPFFNPEYKNLKRTYANNIRKEGQQILTNKATQGNTYGSRMGRINPETLAKSFDSKDPKMTTLTYLQRKFSPEHAKVLNNMFAQELKNSKTIEEKRNKLTQILGDMKQKALTNNATTEIIRSNSQKLLNTRKNSTRKNSGSVQRAQSMVQEIEGKTASSSPSTESVYSTLDKLPTTTASSASSIYASLIRNPNTRKPVYSEPTTSAQETLYAQLPPALPPPRPGSVPINLN